MGDYSLNCTPLGAITISNWLMLKRSVIYFIIIEVKINNAKKGKNKAVRANQKPFWKDAYSYDSHDCQTMLNWIKQMRQNWSQTSFPQIYTSPLLCTPPKQNKIENQKLSQKETLITPLKLYSIWYLNLHHSHVIQKCNVQMSSSVIGLSSNYSL